MDVTLAARPSPQRCVYCYDALDGELSSCAKCGTQLHADCFAELGRCPTLGCGEPSRPGDERARAEARASLGRRLRWRGVRGALIAGLAGLVLGFVLSKMGWIYHEIMIPKDTVTLRDLTFWEQLGRGWPFWFLVLLGVGAVLAVLASGAFDAFDAWWTSRRLARAFAAPRVPMRLVVTVNTYKDSEGKQHEFLRGFLAPVRGAGEPRPIAAPPSVLHSHRSAARLRVLVQQAAPGEPIVLEFPDGRLEVASDPS